ncbi:MAG TPA: GNAT family N-acetyltransferase [Eubacteriales bacterium]|nr:GNAT family N-acetyltransferase [Eubacteriales bacterium]
MINFREIDRNNIWDILKLKVSEEQMHFVATNAVSIAQAKAQPECVPLAIYDGETPVGFVMYCFDLEEKEYCIYRLMIDSRYQRKGYGRDALQKIIDKIKEDKDHHKILISFEPNNSVAKSLYISMGFVPDGRIIDGELVCVLEY